MIFTFRRRVRSLKTSEMKDRPDGILTYSTVPLQPHTVHEPPSHSPCGSSLFVHSETTSLPGDARRESFVVVFKCDDVRRLVTKKTSAFHNMAHFLLRHVDSGSLYSSHGRPAVTIKVCARHLQHSGTVTKHPDQAFNHITPRLSFILK